ncbi:DNA polymerase III, beta subunit [Hallella bergensis DSM 17361]|uniref:Beta sliding clamp n=1 Tax=Hallella bergensis DSM 17361 TaxID=585502 RepID=D1PV57_9BACT|nr:DNA polymerase III subunit beta [Hallella bergensis]EFA44777.1 DNA polymerase III, beta subunit [Hallella bergensis DSM 17361]
MRFTLSSTALNSRLQTLSKVINNKNSLPILESFLMQVHNGQLTITASDNENMMQASLALDNFDTDGVFAIPSHTILDAVKELPEQPLTFEVNPDTYEVTVGYQNGQYQFAAQNADDYPRNEPLSGDVHVITIDAEMLCNSLSRTLFATDNNEIRPVMNGVYFDLTPDCLSFVASDGHKLVRCRNYSIKSDIPASLIMPKKPATLLKNTLAKEHGDVVIKFNDQSAEVKYSEGLLICRLIEGVFPNYNAAIPTDNPNEVNIDRKVLLSAIRRVLPFASMSSQLVRFRLNTGSLEVSSEDLDFATRAKEELVCEYNGQPMQIGFRGDFLMEILNSLDTDEIKIQLGDPSRAGVVIPATQLENEDLLMLIMPLLLND